MNQKDRYKRHYLLESIGEIGQKKLREARVLVVGAGGLGCAVLPYLASCGVGTIGVVDFDTIDESNLHRQVCYREADIGQGKAETMRNFLLALNPEIQIETYPVQLRYENALEIFKPYQIIVDCTDNFQARWIINDMCVGMSLPHVYAGIHKFEGQVSVFNVHKSSTYRCVFGENAIGQNCEELGVLGVLPGVIGTLQATEVLKMILGIGELLVDKVLTINLLNHQQYLLSTQPNELMRSEALNNFNQINSQMEPLSTYSSIDLSELNKLSVQENTSIIDVREPYEMPKLGLVVNNIPLRELGVQLDSLDKEGAYILVCQHGVRSLHAIEFLAKNGFRNLYNLEGGIAKYLGEH